MVSCDKSSSVKVWDYESCKINHLLEMEVPPCALKVAEQRPLLAIGCPNDKVYIYRFSRPNHKFSVEFVKYGHLRYPHSNFNSLLSFESLSHVVTPSQRYL